MTSIIDERIASNVGPARIDIAYETRGNPNHPPVLLIMGLGAQLVHWPDGFIEALAAHDLYVIRFDNRDSGHSSHMTDDPMPDFSAALRNDFSSVSYTLSDMAADTVGLLDALGIRAAHLVGASLGAAIAQTVAIEHPGRVLSLCSMMFTTGDAAVGQMHPAAQEALFGEPPAKTKEDAIAQSLRLAPVVRSPAYPASPKDIATTAGIAWDRDHDPMAPARQGIASIASGDRTQKLRNLTVPTLVIHGTEDTVCDVSGGRATAAAIPGAELVLIEGMGHDLPAALWDFIADRIAGHVGRVRQGGEIKQG